MNLVMLTKFYPYGTGEAFIENEMNVLYQYYDRILVIACEAPDTSIIRSVPKNVTVRKVMGVDSRGKIADVVKGQLNYIKSSKEFRTESKNCRSLKQKGFLGYFEGKCQRVYREFRKENLLKDFVDAPFVLYSYWLFMTARVATYILRDYKVSYIFTRAHRYDLYAEKNGTNYLPYRELFLNSFNKVFPCSINGERYLQEHYPEYKEKVRVALLGTLDHGIGKPSTDGIFRVVSCSRIVAEKRIDRIAVALALLDNKGLNIKWTHIGGGTGLEAVKQKTEGLLTKIQFEFLGDTPNTKVMELYKEKPFDIFLNVSSSEGLPVSIMEAISFGMPVIATDVGGTSEITITGKTGLLLADEFKNEDLASAIEKLYHTKESEEYQKYRVTCRAYWEQHFQAMVNYNELYSFIQKDKI